MTVWKRHKFLLLVLLFCLILAVCFLGLFGTYRKNHFAAAKTDLPDKFFVNSVQRIVRSCRDNFSWRDCYGEELGRLNKSVSFADTLKVLEGIKQEDKKVRDCHLIAHWVSLSEVERNPGNWINIFNYVDQTTCNNGFVHGVLEGRSRADPNFKITQDVIINTCDLIDKKTSQRLGVKEGGSDDACGHIMGHILLAERVGNIPETITVCEKLPANLRVSCFQGTFMENVTRENLQIHQIAEKLNFTEQEATELEKVCGNYKGEPGMSCWRELSHIFTILAGNEPLKSYQYCYLNNNNEFAHECYMHAINLIVLSPDYTKENLQNTCKPYWQDLGQLNTCVSRTVGPLLGSSVDFIDRAADFCGLIPEVGKVFCYSKIGERLKSKVQLKERQNLCVVVPEKFRGYCLAE